MKLQAIIIDDEPNVRKALELLLEVNCPEISVCGSACSAQEARRIIESRDVDFIFLDISMPGEDGFVFLSSIPCENYGIIFITAYQGFALRAINASSFDYLLKPVDAIELKAAVAKAIQYHRLRKQQAEALKIYRESLVNLLLQIGSEKQAITKITIPLQLGFRVIVVADLMYLQADGNFTILHSMSIGNIVTTRLLDDFEKILVKPQFFRIHNSTIINMNYLKFFSGFEGNPAVLTDGTTLSVSRRKLIEFREAIEQFTQAV